MLVPDFAAPTSSQREEDSLHPQDLHFMLAHVVGMQFSILATWTIEFESKDVINPCVVNKLRCWASRDQCDCWDLGRTTSGGRHTICIYPSSFSELLQIEEDLTTSRDFSSRNASPYIALARRAKLA
jgi:hypothetical protein